MYRLSEYHKDIVSYDMLTDVPEFYEIKESKSDSARGNQFLPFAVCHGIFLPSYDFESKS